MAIPKIQIPQKPNYKKISLEEDFFSLFQKIEKNFTTCFLFESLGTEYDSRYSIIGFSPKSIIKARGKSLFIDEEEYLSDNPYYLLREYLPTNVLTRLYAGGLIGYLSYESMNYFEPSLQLPLHKDFETFLFGLFLDGLILDTMTGEIFYFYYGSEESNRSEQVIAIAKQKLPTNPGNPKVDFLGYTMTRDEHRRAVLQTIEEIKSGNTFQCQIGFKSEYKITGDTLPIYAKLRQVNPSPHMFYFKHGDKKIIGASPELLFRLRDGDMETFPLAGSIRRGNKDNPGEDLKMARTLLNDPKEIAEHNMLVDLHRNDLGRVARYGSVKVRRLMDVKKFSHIQHISSEVTGVISKKDDMFSGLASNFPAGTLSGAPKIESMKIIHRMESDPRGPYGGSIGHFGLDGNCIFAIPIRSLFISGTDAYTQASGGIVYDSTPENEYDEIMRKSAAMASVLQHFQEDAK
ncbi:MAG: anthranilate synthase component I family protein [Spirochaetota bacterium]